jgi:hypothetical protein
MADSCNSGNFVIANSLQKLVAKPQLKAAIPYTIFIFQ